jgi:hypothetical protein
VAGASVVSNSTQLSHNIGHDILITSNNEQKNTSTKQVATSSACPLHKVLSSGVVVGVMVLGSVVVVVATNEVQTIVSVKRQGPDVPKEHWLLSYSSAPTSSTAAVDEFVVVITGSIPVSSSHSTNPSPHSPLTEVL